MTKVFIVYENGERIEIKNGQFFSPEDNVLSYGEFTPPLTYEQDQVSKLSFSKLLLSDNLIILGISCFNVLKLPNEEFVELKLFSIPEPHPFPEFLNESLVNESDACFVHLFYKSSNSPDLSYVSSISSPWNALYKAIDHELSLKGCPLFQIKVGIITSNVTMPILEDGNTFFSAPGSIAKGKRIMSIVASSNPELIVAFGKEKFSTSNLADIPKYIAHRVAILLRRTKDRNVSKYLRRMLSLSIDNCLALEFLDMCEVTHGDTNLKPENFERSLLHLGNCDYFFSGNLINQLVNFPLTSYLAYAGPKSNEHTLCGSFWDPLVNILIRSGEQVPHRMEWEWESTKLYPNHPLRRVDLVYLAEFIGVNGKQVSIPFLQAESGKDFFTGERQHKDTTKLFGLMSANCITLAHELIAVGKKPELARAYGMLNGGIKTQLCVAVPIISEVGDNLFQIHTHISFPKHWELVCFGNQENEDTNCTDVCCRTFAAADGEVLLETIAKPETPYRFAPGPIDDEHGEFQVEPEDNEEEAEVANFQDNPINYSSFKKIATFILIVKEQLKRIYLAPTDESGRNFLPPNDRYYFSQSITITKGQTGTTPSEVRVTESSRDEPRTPIRQISQDILFFNMTKSSSKELQIYRKCSAYFPASFPRIYQVNETEAGLIDYTFEKMLPLIEDGRCSSLILSNSCSAMNNLISSIKFTMNCLFNLHILHEVIGVIHRDISPANIMYSKVDENWKIIDYNLSIEKSESKSETSRIVGTRGYIAPESEASGIYSEASDVFSLGTVIFDIIYGDLLRQFMYESDEEDLPTELVEFEFVLSDMFNPLRRISVEDALKKLFNLMKKIVPKEHQIFKEEIFNRIQNLNSIKNENEN